MSSSHDSIYSGLSSTFRPEPREEGERKGGEGKGKGGKRMCSVKLNGLYSGVVSTFSKKAAKGKKGEEEKGGRRKGAGSVSFYFWGVLRDRGVKKGRKGKRMGKGKKARDSRQAWETQQEPIPKIRVSIFFQGSSSGGGKQKGGREKEKEKLILRESFTYLSAVTRKKKGKRGRGRGIGYPI